MSILKNMSNLLFGQTNTTQAETAQMLSARMQQSSKLNLKDSFVTLKKNRFFLVNAHISPYSHTGIKGHKPTRDRELLLHKKEIIKLKNVVAQKGLTIVPLKAYFKRGIAKIEFATARGKKMYQKKESLKIKDLDREA